MNDVIASMDPNTRIDLIMGIFAEIAAGNGTSQTRTLGEIDRVEPPEGWSPPSEPAAFIVMAACVRTLWANARWMADADAADAQEAWRGQVASTRERANYCRSLGFTSDAGCNLKNMRQAAAVVRGIATHPAAWEKVKVLLADDDHSTWSERVAAMADESYPGWRDMPFSAECGMDKMMREMMMKTRVDK